MENLKIKGGALGPIRELPETGLEICPLTIFIGKQGTGKSLVSQLVYFFRNLPFLVRYHEARLGPDVKDDEIVRAILNALRSAGGNFWVFAEPSLVESVVVKYSPLDERQPAVALEISRMPDMEAHDSSGSTLQFRLGGIHPYQSITDAVARIRAEKRPAKRLGHAAYVPAERVLYSHARGPSAWQVLSLPSTLVIFADMMEEAANTFKGWRDGKPNTKEGRWVWEQGRKALAGEVYRRGETWRWRIDEAKEIDVDMASSGQKANWPLVLFAEALFSWLKERLIEAPFHLHVEEPEIHLHPEAQVAIVEILAYLVNQGFRVLITTHSLTVLYAINNLMLAYQKLRDKDVGGEEQRVPERETRLSPEDVAAYSFTERGGIENIVDRDVGQIDEGKLGEELGKLEAEFNRLFAYGVLWE